MINTAAENCKRREENGMAVQMSLLDALQQKACCSHLSDLRFLNRPEQARLAREIEQIPTSAASLFEWNDALAYLVNGPPQDTPEAARERLTCLLGHPERIEAKNYFESEE
ncbi:hypothetical protein HJV15_12390 [[Clostridium] scindens]|nr:hypothetical protein [[Clostridium] scindens]MBS5697164.1 hypothetical protein [Lachnospiraceae bacterium]